MKIWGILIACFVVTMGALVFGFGMGYDHGRETTPPKVVVEMQTRTVTKEVPAALPDQCMYAMATLRRVAAAYDGITNSAGSNQIDLMSDAQVAMLERDFTGLNRITIQQRDRIKGLQASAVKVAEARDEFDRYMNSCLRQLKEGS